MKKGARLMLAAIVMLASARAHAQATATATSTGTFVTPIQYYKNYRHEFW